MDDVRKEAMLGALKGKMMALGKKAIEKAGPAAAAAKEKAKGGAMAVGAKLKASGKAVKDKSLDYGKEYGTIMSGARINKGLKNAAKGGDVKAKKQLLKARMQTHGARAATAGTLVAGGYAAGKS